MGDQEYDEVRAAIDGAKVFTLPARAIDPWPALDPLPETDEPEAIAFPLDALGPVLGGAAHVLARDVQAPEALAAAGVLAGASLAFQPLADVMLPHGQRSPLSLFIVTAAESGDRKSRVDQVANHEIEKARASQARDHVKQLRDYEKQIAERRSNPPKDKSPDPAPPAARSLITGNATIEGLAATSELWTSTTSQRSSDRLPKGKRFHGAQTIELWQSASSVTWRDLSRR